MPLVSQVWYLVSDKRANASIVTKRFTETGIIAPLTRVAIFALPLCSVDDVVSSVVKCSTDETFSGNTVFVDADGILAIPFEMPAASTSGYYAAVAKRGVYTTS